MRWLWTQSGMKMSTASDSRVCGFQGFRGLGLGVSLADG